MTTKAEEKAGEERCGARVCKGCGGEFPITCATGDFDGYWHLDCLRKARNGTGRQPAEPAAAEGEHCDHATCEHLFEAACLVANNIELEEKLDASRARVGELEAELERLRADHGKA